MEFGSLPSGLPVSCSGRHEPSADSPKQLCAVRRQTGLQGIKNLVSEEEKGGNSRCCGLSETDSDGDCSIFFFRKFILSVAASVFFN